MRISLLKEKGERRKKGTIISKAEMVELLCFELLVCSDS